ncbi:uncharacterized protein CYBJADRAFT_168581 [Cyberlindnera jadinii NRRL Y-1542]|uniref:Uncharacterized protein n=1 Tax=Cyberlindnera jadinii (strain ATCC 18201 / CBS 1600 / BCRC 20928 / JCM 3617 / NBRC 0987 / NRRL Y-1542) TaxID=983966 RepID=A0A1E4RYT5_CYBJN|nr:hypothetical protein CYBJADRAFT_168581 [Cyberlindnera jadinii NRRL Y-1542]ODV72255.1 hypothetical protein CYBJADRAFT_168581 [Cyberlindnera jadinii NRRL Y-1542]
MTTAKSETVLSARERLLEKGSRASIGSEYGTAEIIARDMSWGSIRTQSWEPCASVSDALPTPVHLDLKALRKELGRRPPGPKTSAPLIKRCPQHLQYMLSPITSSSASCSTRRTIRELYREDIPKAPLLVHTKQRRFKTRKSLPLNQIESVKSILFYLGLRRAFLVWRTRIIMTCSTYNYINNSTACETQVYNHLKNTRNFSKWRECFQSLSYHDIVKDNRPNACEFLEYVSPKNLRYRDFERISKEKAQLYRNKMAARLYESHQRKLERQLRFKQVWETTVGYIAHWFKESLWL